MSTLELRASSDVVDSCGSCAPRRSGGATAARAAAAVARGDDRDRRRPGAGALSAPFRAAGSDRAGRSTSSSATRSTARCRLLEPRSRSSWRSAPRASARHAGDPAGRRRSSPTSPPRCRPCARCSTATCAPGFDGDPSATSVDEISSASPASPRSLATASPIELYALGVPLIARIVAEDAHRATGIDIHPGAEIGERLLHRSRHRRRDRRDRDHRPQRAPLPGRHAGREALRDRRADGGLRKSYPRHPIVEDDVVIYAGATHPRPHHIGQGSTIGGNVWLTHSVPPGSRVTQAKARTTFDGGAGIECPLRRCAGGRSADRAARAMGSKALAGARARSSPCRSSPELLGENQRRVDGKRPRRRRGTETANGH